MLEPRETLTDQHAWEDAARQAIRSLISAGEPFTTDDIWMILDDKGIPHPREPRALGGIIQGFAHRSEIAHKGFKRAARRTANCRPLSIWSAINSS